jgi:hypothetical protein
MEKRKFMTLLVHVKALLIRLPLPRGCWLPPVPIEMLRISVAVTGFKKKDTYTADHCSRCICSLPLRRARLLNVTHFVNYLTMEATLKTFTSTKSGVCDRFLFTTLTGVTVVGAAWRNGCSWKFCKKDNQNY